MVRSADQLFETVFENRTRGNGESDAAVEGERPLSRSELADIVKQGVADGLERYDQSDDEAKKGTESDAGSSRSRGRSITKRLAVGTIGLAILVYLRNRRDETVGESEVSER